MPIRLSPKHFRFLIIANWLLAVFGMVLEFSTESLLPPTLRQYIEADSNSEITITEIAIFATDFALMLFAVVISVGLFLFKGWARNLFPFFMALSILQTALVGPTVELAVLSAQSYLSSVIDGVLLALIFWSPIRKHFR